MKCPNCNESTHAPGAVYCHMCGSPLQVSAPPSVGVRGSQFEFAENFSEGLAKVELGGKIGFIDKTGRLVIPPTFNLEGQYVFGLDTHSGFSEGLAAVSMGEYPNRMYGFVDHSGNMVIQPQFACAWHFSEGLAPVLQDGKWGYVDKTGQVVIRPVYERAGFFSEGLALVKTMKGEYEYINKSGLSVISKTRNLLYDPDGDPIIFHHATLSVASAFHDGLARARCFHNAGFIDKTGRFRKIKGYQAYGDFSGGLAAIVCENTVNRYGYIDPNMKVVIKPVYEGAGDFHDGLAAVKQGGKYGFINGSGDVIIPFQFDGASSFHEGLAAVKVNDKIGYVNGNGSFVISPQFESARNYSEGFAAVKSNGAWRFIDKSGVFVT